TETHYRRIREKSIELSGKALRTLAMAERVLPRDPREPDDPPDEEDIEDELCFLGLVGMIDPPRPEAAESVRKAQRAGIKVVMATGDHPATALAIARELGILTEGGRSLTGPEVEGMSDADL